MHDFLQAAHDTWLGTFARSNGYLFTIGLVIHFIGLCLLLGAMLVIDLRVLGFAKRAPIGAVLQLVPVALIGFTLNLLTGIMFFCFDPFGYWGNPAFKIKLTLLLVAGLNALWFTLAEHKALATTPPDHDAQIQAKIGAGLSLFLWFAIILFGRLIVAFQNSPDLFK